jgi:2-polyprenyl-3-methyl-5-hydroxy-6-metoxy-1,4-benzoquinol methylase
LIGCAISGSAKHIKPETMREKNRSRVINLYKGEGFLSTFSRIRFWDGPIYDVEKRIPKKGTILDLGCGEGILSNYIAVKCPKRNILGIELNKKRIEKAQRGLRNTKFIQGNILKHKLPRADTYVISDVLHHFPSKKDQENFLKKIYKKMRKKNKLIIAEIDRGLSFKYMLCFFVDAIVVPVLFERKPYDLSFVHRSRHEWMELLTKIGYKVKFFKGNPNHPFPDIIFECEK